VIWVDQAVATPSGLPANVPKVRGGRVVVSGAGALQEIRLPAKRAPDGIVKVR